MTEISPGKSILVVDDEVPIRTMLVAVLETKGHAVIGAYGREEVLRLLKLVAFDLIITDILMPDFDGTEVIKAAKMLQPAARIIAMSGGGARITPELCLEIGKAMSGRTPLVKPFTIAVFTEAVARALSASGGGD